MLAAPDAAAASLRANAAAEKAVLDAGLPVAVLRATYMMETLPRHVRGSRATVLGRQPHTFHLLAAADLATMVSHALRSGDLAGRVLTVRGPEPYRLTEALRRYCEVLRPTVTVSSHPLWLMRILDRTVLRHQLGDTLNLMRAMEKEGEIGDARPAQRLPPPPRITLTEWAGRADDEVRPEQLVRRPRLAADPRTSHTLERGSTTVRNSACANLVGRRSVERIVAKQGLLTPQEQAERR